MLRDRRTLLGLLGAAVVSVAVMPFLLQAEDPELSLRRRRLAGMTQAEREHVQRNFETFAALDDAGRQQLRDFETELEADKANNRGRANETLRIYGEWLQTVSPSDRDALQKESDSATRIAMIGKLVEGQRDERIEVRIGDRREEFLGPIPNISPEDLEAMLAVIDGKAAFFVSSRAELEEYEGIPRILKLFEMMARSGKTVLDVLNESNAGQLMAAISDETTRTALETIPDNHRPRPQAKPFMRRLKLGIAIQRAIWTELDRERHAREISRENLGKFFEELPEGEQDELLALTPDQFRQQLLGKYLETDWSRNRIDIKLVRRFFSPNWPPGKRPQTDPRRRDNRPGSSGSRPPGRPANDRDQ